MLEIVPLVLGSVSTNCYLVADSNSGEAVVIDPAWDGRLIHAEAKKRSGRSDNSGTRMPILTTSPGLQDLWNRFINLTCPWLCTRKTWSY